MTGLKTQIMLEKILEYVEDTEDPDMFCDLEIEYQDIITRAKELNKKIEEIFLNLNLKI